MVSTQNWRKKPVCDWTFRSCLMLPVSPRVMSFVLSKIFICLSVTISLIRSEGGVGGRREEDRAPERGRRRGVLSTSPPNNTLPHRRLGLWLLLSFSSPHPLFFSLSPCLTSLCFRSIHSLISTFASVALSLPVLKVFHSVWLFLSVYLHFNTSHSCLSITRTAEAIITFHPSIKHSQLWSISTLSPLHSTALNLKCLPSVSVSTYLAADKAILDSGVDDYYNRFHNAFQHCVVCVGVGVGVCVL